MRVDDTLRALDWLMSRRDRRSRAGHGVRRGASRAVALTRPCSIRASNRCARKHALELSHDCGSARAPERAGNTPRRSAAQVRSSDLLLAIWPRPVTSYVLSTRSGPSSTTRDSGRRSPTCSNPTAKLARASGQIRSRTEDGALPIDLSSAATLDTVILGELQS